jgi:hypothetical protein
VSKGEGIDDQSFLSLSLIRATDPKLKKKKTSPINLESCTHERHRQVVIRLLDRPQDRFTLLDIRRHRFLRQHPDPPFEGGDDVLVVCGVYCGYYQDFDLLVVEHSGEGVKGVFGGGLGWSRPAIPGGSSASNPRTVR